MTQLLSHDGPLAGTLPSFEERPQQIEMATAVEEALQQSQGLIVEAPCGVGKSFAYLLPAARTAREEETPIVVATANIALQEQIIRKDLPAIANLFDPPLTFALLKGISNYLCLDKFEELCQSSLFDADRIQPLQQWRRTTRTGDRSEITFPMDRAAWASVSAGAHECHGHDCAHYDRCFAMRARKHARLADIIVTNYHTLFAHIRVKSLTGDDLILPHFCHLICDEGHEIAPIARTFFGHTLSHAGFARNAAGARLLKDSSLEDNIKSSSKHFFLEVSNYSRNKKYHIRLREPNWIDPKPLIDTVVAFEQAFDTALKHKPEHPTEEDLKTFSSMRRYRRMALEQIAALQSFASLCDPNQVYWIEDSRRGTRLLSQCIDATTLLQEYLWSSLAGIVVTSATLTTGESFDFIQREIGLTRPDAQTRTLKLSSPFDLPNQMLTILPKIPAHPHSDEFVTETAGIIRTVAQHLQGRTLALFTSWRNLTKAAEQLAGTNLTLLVQGDQPRSQLLESFRQDNHTLLLATASFWQGVDVPGNALSAVIIDKIPFLSTQDPFMDAIETLRNNSFISYNLPNAILSLRQGSGRLIRSRSDRGVVIILDPRLQTKGYGRTIIKSLSDAHITTDIRDIESFFAPK